MSILIALVLFVLSIIVHELGHYFAALRQKVDVQTFSLGVDPRLIKLFTKKGTDFVIRLIPLGASVETVEPIANVDRRKRWKIIIAGPLANAVFGGLFLFLYVVPVDFNFSDIPALFVFFFVCQMVSIVAMFVFIPLNLAALIGVFGFADFSGSVGITNTIASSNNEWMGIFWFVNIALASFNLLPIVPLDGGLLLQALSERYKTTRLTGVINWLKQYLSFYCYMQCCVRVITTL